MNSLFQNDNSLSKLLFTKIKNIQKKYSMLISNWTLALSQIELKYRKIDWIVNISLKFSFWRAMIGFSYQRNFFDMKYLTILRSNNITTYKEKQIAL